MRVLGLLCVVLRGICWANAASHSLKYIYTVVTGNIDSPEFIITGFVNDEQFVHYDSKIRRMIPKTEWMEKSVDEQYWDKQTQKALYAHQIFKDNIVIAMQHFRSTQDVPILEWIVACWWNDETGDTGGIDRYGYDGKYFLTDEMKTWHFIPPAQFISAVKWNPAELENDKQYQTQICIESLKKYVSYRSTLERTVAPEVSLLHQDSSSPVITCHVTGFYPRDIMVTWQRNGEDLDENVELEEMVRNEDGTFQTTSNLTVKPEDWKSQNYTCTVQHKSLKQDIILPVREENIKRNTDMKTRSFSPDGSSPPMGVSIGCGVVTYILVLPLTFAVIGFVIWEKRSSDYESTKTRSFNPDGSSSLMGVLIGCLVGAFIHVLTLLDFIIWKKRSSDYETTKTFEKDSGHFTNMQLIHRTSDRLAACDTYSTNSNKIRPAATNTDSVNSTQPAATDTGPVNSTQPAATDTDSVNSTQPLVSISLAFPAASGIPAQPCWPAALY